MFLQYSLLWFVLVVIAILNGILREWTYGRYITELLAHQLSTLTGIMFSGAFVYFVHQYWPIASMSQAWKIGFIWLVATVLFEFGFGHYIAGHSWQRLINDYNIFEGRVWMLFLIWVVLMPVIIYRYG